MEFSYKTTFWKGVKYFLAFALPFLVSQFVVAFPDVANLTIGAAILMLCNLLKNKYGLRLP